MKILDLLKNCKRIGISGHENPDGDCAGSCCGLALFLRKAMPDAQTDIYLGELPDSLQRCIPGADTIIHEVPHEAERYDAFIVLDSNPERIGEAYRLYEEAPVRINIDHHATNHGSENAHCFIDGGASSACELVYDVLDKKVINMSIAQALYIGMVTDTGVFRFSNTSESTMRIAGHLMSYGFDFPTVVREVFYERSLAQSRALGLALTKAEYLFDGKAVFCILDYETLCRTGAKRKDLDGISEQLALTYGVDCSFFVHETESKEWRVSMRSVGSTDVSRTARLFGGGGHVKAAGCTIKTDLDEALKVIKSDIEEQLRSANLI